VFVKEGQLLFGERVESDHIGKENGFDILLYLASAAFIDFCLRRGDRLLDSSANSDSISGQ